jgi:hypothetical protein
MPVAVTMPVRAVFHYVVEFKSASHSSASFYCIHGTETSLARNPSQRRSLTKIFKGIVPGLFNSNALKPQLRMLV